MFFDNKGFRGNPAPFHDVDDGLLSAPIYTTSYAAKMAQPMQMPALHSATDLRPRCATNIPVGQQFATRKWLAANTDAIISLSRKRHEERIIDCQPAREGTVTIPGYELLASCNPDACQYKQTGMPQAIGIKRTDSAAVELPGTWANAYLYRGGEVEEGFAGYPKEEGGRNTRRG
jgi:hypothetical protein